MSRLLPRLALLAVSALLPVAVHAQLFRAYLASTGSDANPCTVVQPCRLLPAALNAVATSGEIWMLDSANYNTATVEITKSVSILAVPGAVGSVVLPVGSNAAINITVSTSTISLRNLRVVPLPGASGAGIVSVGGAFPRIHVEHVEFSRLLGAAIDIDGTDAGTTDLLVNDSTIESLGIGIRVRGNVRATLSGLKVFRAPANSVVLDTSFPGTTTTVTVTDSVIHCSGIGNGLAIENPAPSGGTGRMHVARTSVTRCQNGILIDANNSASSQVYLASSQVTENVTGIAILGSGTVFTLGGNQVSGNGTPVTGALTPFTGL